jgi:hypothetical protein
MNSPNCNAAALAIAAPAADGVRIQVFAGALNGWRDASPAVVDAATAARRLRLYRAVRGDAFIYRVSGSVLPGESVAPVLPRHGDAAPVLPVLPARRNATPWHARTVPNVAVYAFFAATFAVGGVLAARDLAAPAPNVHTVRVAAR